MDRVFDITEPFAVLDAGSKSFYILHHDGTESVVSRESLLDCQWLKGEKQIVGEYAHLAVAQSQGPNSQASLSQPFSNDDLVNLYDTLNRLGVSGFYWPEKMTGKARRFLFGKGCKVQKTDVVDCKAIKYWLLNRSFSVQPMKRNRVCQSAIRDHVKLINCQANAARAVSYSGQLGWSNQIDYAARAKNKMKIGVSQHFNLFIRNKYDCGKDWENALRMLDHASEGYKWSCVALVIDAQTGESRKHPSGRFFTVKEIIKYGCGFSPNHGNRGVVRSNIMYHFARNRLKSELHCKPAT